MVCVCGYNAMSARYRVRSYRLDTPSSGAEHDRNPLPRYKLSV